jgi:hypothetical protein
MSRFYEETTTTLFTEPKFVYSAHKNQQLFLVLNQMNLLPKLVSLISLQSGDNLIHSSFYQFVFSIQANRTAFYMRFSIRDTHTSPSII